MKAILRTVLLLMILIAMGSCSNDDNQEDLTPVNLAGTTWKCSTDLSWDENLEYLILKFTSSTGVEGWSKYKNIAFQRDWKGTYTITGKTITIDEVELDETITGTINGVNMSLTSEGAEGDLTFTLQ